MNIVEFTIFKNNELKDLVFTTSSNTKLDSVRRSYYLDGMGFKTKSLYQFLPR